MATHPGLALPIGDVFIPLRYHSTVGYLDSEGNRRKIPEGEILLVIVDVSSPKEKKQKICSAIFIDGKFRVGLFLKTYQPWRIKAVKRTGQKIDPPKLPATLPEIRRSNIFVILPPPVTPHYEDVQEEEWGEIKIIYDPSVEEKYLAASIRMMDVETKHQEEMRRMQEKSEDILEIILYIGTSALICVVILLMILVINLTR